MNHEGQEPYLYIYSASKRLFSRAKHGMTINHGATHSLRNSSERIALLKPADKQTNK